MIPRSLFGDNPPRNLITVPACEACDNEKSLNDDFLRDMLVMDVQSSEHPLLQADLRNKMYRAVQRNLSALGRLVVAESKDRALYTRGGIYLGSYPAVTIEETRVSRIFSMIVRGLYYKARKQRLPDDCVFKARRLPPLEEVNIWQHLAQLGCQYPYRLGDVFLCAFVTVEEDPAMTIWLLGFYNSAFFTVLTHAVDFDLESYRAARQQN